MNKHGEKASFQDVLSKETGKLKLFKHRTYDIVDLFAIGTFNLIVFLFGFGLGWLVWGNNAYL